jgi:hypothetical protein
MVNPLTAMGERMCSLVYVQLANPLTAMDERIRSLVYIP